MKTAGIAFWIMVVAAAAQTGRQPKVAPGPGEPDWEVVLKDRFGLAMHADLLNPVRTTPEKAAGLFRKAGPGPARFTPLIALGLETRTRGGWYAASAEKTAPARRGLWSYVFKNTTDDLKNERNLPPPLENGATVQFDPGAARFGLWVANDGLPDGGVYSEPARVALHNARLRKQPYKAMIYPVRDRRTGKPVPGSFLIGWEYSTNDDFQDVVCRLDNAVLIED